MNWNCWLLWSQTTCFKEKSIVLPKEAFFDHPVLMLFLQHPMLSVNRFFDKSHPNNDKNYDQYLPNYLFNFCPPIRFWDLELGQCLSCSSWYSQHPAQEVACRRQSTFVKWMFIRMNEWMNTVFEICWDQLKKRFQQWYILRWIRMYVCMYVHVYILYSGILFLQ